MDHQEKNSGRTSDLELDVRQLPHMHRHETIFAELERLRDGQALIITNDHDPAPLGYQLRALYGDQFGWDYLERGPKQWRVAIRRGDGQDASDADDASADNAAGSSSTYNEASLDMDLEVRHLPPAQRHELIFKTYYGLAPGESFILINDHDPKPLYYQFAFEHKDEFTWEPIESGPEVWRVRIGKV